MKRWFALLGVLLLAGVLVAGCGGNAGSDASSGKQVLRVGMDASYPPFGSQDQDTQDYVGYDVDIIRAIGEQEGFEVQISNRSFDGLIPALQSHDTMWPSMISRSRTNASECRFFEALLHCRPRCRGQGGQRYDPYGQGPRGQDARRFHWFDR